MRSRRASSTARAGADGSPRLRCAIPTRRGRRPSTSTNRNRARRWGGTAVAGSTAGPYPSNVSEARRRTPSSSTAGPQPHSGGLHGRVDLAAKRGAGGGEKELEALEVADVDALHARQRVVVDRHHEHDVLFEEELGHEVAPRDREGEHGQVEAPRRQLGLEAQGGAVGHHEVEAGMAGGQVGEEGGHEPASRRAQDAHPDVAGHGFA